MKKRPVASTVHHWTRWCSCKLPNERVTVIGSSQFVCLCLCLSVRQPHFKFSNGQVWFSFTLIYAYYGIASVLYSSLGLWHSFRQNRLASDLSNSKDIWSAILRSANLLLIEETARYALRPWCCITTAGVHETVPWIWLCCVKPRQRVTSAGWQIFNSLGGSRKGELEPQ